MASSWRSPIEQLEPEDGEDVASGEDMIVTRRVKKGSRYVFDQAMKDHMNRLAAKLGGMDEYNTA